MTKILALSNIHGRHDELVDLFQRVTKDYNLSDFDKIVFLGDYISFGKKNKEVIELLLNLKKKHSNVLLLKGNWEDVLYTIQTSQKSKAIKQAENVFSQYGQMEMLEELRKHKDLLDQWVKEINNMPLYHVESDYLFSHAGPNLSKWQSSKDMDDFLNKVNTSRDYLWSIDNYTYYLYYWTSRLITDKQVHEPFPYKIVFGQTAINKLNKEDKSTKYTAPFQAGHAYGIDFGGVYSKGQIGAVVFDDSGMRTYVTDVGHAPALKEKSVPTPKETSAPTSKKDEATFLRTSSGGRIYVQSSNNEQEANTTQPKAEPKSEPKTQSEPVTPVPQVIQEVKQQVVQQVTQEVPVTPAERPQQTRPEPVQQTIRPSATSRFVGAHAAKPKPVQTLEPTLIQKSTLPSAIDLENISFGKEFYNEMSFMSSKRETEESRRRQNVKKSLDF